MHRTPLLSIADETGDVRILCPSQPHGGGRADVISYPGIRKFGEYRGRKFWDSLEREERQPIDLRDGEPGHDLQESELELRNRSSRFVVSDRTRSLIR